jgi:integrase
LIYDTPFQFVVMQGSPIQPIADLSGKRIRGSPFTTAGFARMIERAGEAANLGFEAHPHMLRHACGFTLANKGHDTRALQAYLGHKNIQRTVRYTELAPDRFKDKSQLDLAILQESNVLNGALSGPRGDWNSKFAAQHLC